MQISDCSRQALRILQTAVTLAKLCKFQHGFVVIRKGKMDYFQLQFFRNGWFPVFDKLEWKVMRYKTAADVD